MSSGLGSRLALVAVMLGCGPGGRAGDGDDAAVPLPPCAPFDLTLPPPVGDVGGTPSGLVWTGSEYLVLWNGNEANHQDSTLAGIDSFGTLRWTHQIEGWTNLANLAWDGRRAAVVSIFPNDAGLKVTLVDPATQIETTAFETSPAGIGNEGIAGIDGRIAVTWTGAAGRNFFEIVDGQVGPITVVPEIGTLLWSFIATPTGYALGIHDLNYGVLLLDRTFTPERFDVASGTDEEVNPYGPMLAASDDDVIAVHSTKAPVIDVDFVRAGRRIELPLQFASGLTDSVASATVDHGTVYLVANEFDATSHHVGTLVLGADGTAVPQVMFSDPLLTGIPRITRGVDRTALVTARDAIKPSFVLSQRCDQAVE